MFSPIPVISEASHAIINTDTNGYSPCVKIFVYVELTILQYVTLRVVGRKAKHDAPGIKTLRGLLHHIGMRFVQESKIIRNESFLNEFIEVFIPERNTYSGRPFVPV